MVLAFCIIERCGQLLNIAACSILRMIRAIGDTATFNHIHTLAEVINCLAILIMSHILRMGIRILNSSGAARRMPQIA
ncbi:Uncharacterised protein [Enterobacter hormaechei]|nr:Uncharacterised protein [Enterobacter hormaechei]